MSAFFSAPRAALTTLTCPRCEGALEIRRTCHEAYMYCPACRQQFALTPFIPRMDDIMETFLEQLFTDRV